MASKPKMNVHDFPRPPLLEKIPRHLVIKWNNEIVADTKEGYWALETTHPPSKILKFLRADGQRTINTYPKTLAIPLTSIAYYIPRSAVTSAFKLEQIPNRSSLCEWKGRATYWKLSQKASGAAVSGKVWSYEQPTPGFKDIKSYLSFYASGVPWECFVDGEQVQPQEGDFYGGWVTSELEGPMKGGPGTWGW